MSNYPNRQWVKAPDQKAMYLAFWEMSDPNKNSPLVSAPSTLKICCLESEMGAEQIRMGKERDCFFVDIELNNCGYPTMLGSDLALMRDTNKLVFCIYKGKWTDFSKLPDPLELFEYWIEV